MKKKNTKGIFFRIILGIFGIFSLGYFACWIASSYPGAAKQCFLGDLFRSSSYDDILVTRAVDGDTLVLQNKERVRLIGIDTPEMHESAKLHKDSKRSKKDIETIKAMGRRAYAFTRELVENKRVRLEFDVERKDRYGRLLAYAYLKDGTFVNAEIIKNGYASVMTYPPNVKYSGLFVNLYQHARENKLGLWSE